MGVYWGSLCIYILQVVCIDLCIVVLWRSSGCARTCVSRGVWVLKTKRMWFGRVFLLFCFFACIGLLNCPREAVMDVSLHDSTRDWPALAILEEANMFQAAMAHFNTFLLALQSDSPWYSRTSWLGVKHQVFYLLSIRSRHTHTDEG